ncbi:putative lipid II flippase FtsW [Jatrophihabitans telluris]|uniref:Probable peptidoglycan glycosyltransferase FtsW n=1 Tax=Jatrophihabitans telluris TaxID=2038343 RepID=A0ABY4QW48_9ACTN|nr:putative lipid II flippase FtsW [Jatrophihabitans telluris]UQX87189.1 putative lipid II flippase FtsW [Jatrophihabitans telluris]
MINGIRSRVSDTRVVRASGRYLESPYASLQLLAFAGGGLLFFGLLMSASTTISASLHTTGDNIWSQLIREAEFLTMSVPVFWFAMRIPPRVYRRLAYPVLALALVALLGVLIPGVGVTINGAHRWLQLGPFTVQPSEFAKLAVLLWGADLLARKESLQSLHSARHVLVPLVPGFLAIIGLVMMEPDLGTSLCFMLLLIGLLWTVGLPFRFFAVIVLLIAGAVTVMAVTEPYRLQRLTTFLHPNLDPQHHGFQALHGLWALSSGGVFGVGLGRGTLKYGWVPNANTDYVFAVVGEELGLLGTTAVLLLFALFTYAALRIAFRSNDAFIRLVAAGTAIWIAGQALINIGYVTALLPVTGIPLPFISNGGTSLILTCGVLGMLVSFARHEPAAVSAAATTAAAGLTPRWVRWLRLGRPAAVTDVVRRKVRPAGSRTSGVTTSEAGSGRAAGRPRTATQRAATPPTTQRTAAQRAAAPHTTQRATQRAAAQRAAAPATTQRSTAAARADALRPTGTENGRGR